MCPLCPVTGNVSLVCRLGLSKEESLQQNVGQEEVEIKSDLHVSGESTRPQRGPATRQREGHFKKRSRPDLRTRARRNLYKKQEPEQAEVARDTESVAPDIPLYKDGEADAAGVGGPHLPGTSSTAPNPESSEFPVATGASRIQPDPDDLARVSTSPDRIPSLPQETVDQEPKDQKRKSFEQAASASFPEKKPRLEDRQSFRNTIESVHTEKPQPTKEEPKVPPIRVGGCLILAALSPGPFEGQEISGAPLQGQKAPWALVLIMWECRALCMRGVLETDLSIRGIKFFSSSLGCSLC